MNFNMQNSLDFERSIWSVARLHLIRKKTKLAEILIVTTVVDEPVSSNAQLIDNM